MTVFPAGADRYVWESIALLYADGATACWTSRGVSRRPASPVRHPPPRPTTPIKETGDVALRLGHFSGFDSVHNVRAMEAVGAGRLPSWTAYPRSTEPFASGNATYLRLHGDRCGEPVATTPDSSVGQIRNHDEIDQPAPTDDDRHGGPFLRWPSRGSAG